MSFTDLHTPSSRARATSGDMPLELVFDILRRAPPVVWPDPARRRIWAEYVAAQITSKLGQTWSSDQRTSRAAEDVVAAALFSGAAPRVDAFERGDWAQARAVDVLRALLPLAEERRRGECS